MTYTVYWNNICLLSSMEEEFIKNKISKNDYFPFKFEYYGLGKPCSMSDKIRENIKDGEIKGDIIVSTDLDVFQDKNFSKYLDDNFQKKPSLLPINKAISKSDIPDPDNRFHPFIVIPLVMIINTNVIKESKIPNSLEELLHPSFKYQYAFGGIHNSAGRSLLKSLWYLYGNRCVKEFLKGSVITSMPSQAFQKVMNGQLPIAIVPTIFALRRGIQGLKACWPKEGAVAIPSYVTVKNKVPDQDFNIFSKTILDDEHQLQLKSTGDIIPTSPDVPHSPFALENNCRLLYPKWDFLKTFDHEKFYKLCEDYSSF